MRQADFRTASAGGLEMLDEAQPRRHRLGLQQLEKPALALRKRQLAQVLPVRESRSKTKKMRSAGLLLGQARPGAPRSSATPRASSATISPSSRQSGSFAPAVGDLRERLVQSSPLRVLSALAAVDPHLHAVAVELDLMAPAGLRRAAARRAARAAASMNRGGVAATPLRRGSAGTGRAIARLARRAFASMNGVGSRPLPAAIAAMRRPEATDRPCEQCVAVVLRIPSRCLISSQFDALAARAIRSMRTSTHSPFRRSPARRNLSSRLQAAAARTRHGAQKPRSQSCTVPPPYSPWGSCPRSRHSRADDPRPRPQAACRAGRARALGHRPGFEDAIKLKAKVVVQPAGRMLLDDEAPHA